MNAAARLFRIVPPLSDEDATPLACGACGGDYKHADIDEEESEPGTYCVVECRYCTHGQQTPSQRYRWENHKRRVHESGVRRKVVTDHR